MRWRLSTLHAAVIGNTSQQSNLNCTDIHNYFFWISLTTWLLTLPHHIGIFFQLYNNNMLLSHTHKARKFQNYLATKKHTPRQITHLAIFLLKTMIYSKYAHKHTFSHWQAKNRFRVMAFYTTQYNSFTLCQNVIIMLVAFIWNASFVLVE